MNNLQKLGGVAAILEATIYLAAFYVYGVVLDFPTESGAAQKLAFLSDNQFVLSLMNLIGYVLFGILLAVLVLAIHEQLKKDSSILAPAGAVFGIIWVGLVIASGMVANIGLASVIELATTDTEKAATVWFAIATVVEGLGGGNEVVGGLWVLCVSIAAMRNGYLSKTLHVLGIVVGSAGIATIYPAEVLTEIFGISQIIWFIWIGLSMLYGPAWSR